MGQILNELLSAVLQMVAFTLIPFVFFLFRKDKSVSFTCYIGFYKPTSLSIKYSILTSLLFLGTGVAMVFFDEGIRQVVTTPPSVTGKLRLIESSGIAFTVLLIIAILKTSLTEEILFRGFIANRLVNLFGYKSGNILQALIFGLVHLVLFWKLMNPGLFPIMFFFAFSTLAGWVIGLVKEKYANGSIIPGWIAHALGNTLSYSVIVFVL